ncbi:MAG: condensation domain-containing protein, partial [Gammaproteobacteria bacterium]
MIPSFFILIDKIPLTPNGKIDKKALPIPDLSVRLLGASYVAPRTPVESDLGFIWSEILRIPQVGIHDNFFRIGGHSLLATQIISRIRRLYSCDLSLKTLFEGPTIAELAVIVNQILNTSASYTLPLIIQPRSSLIPLSFAQQRLWFLDQLLEKTHLYNISVTFKLSGSLKIAVLEQAFNALIQRHESLRTIFPSKDGEAMQVIIPTLSISLKTETVDPAFVNNLIYQEAHIPFDLAAGPLLRVKVLRLSTKEHILLITLHH